MRDIGPEMLEALEARHSTMSDSDYQARRLEIEELIRKGKAVEHSILPLSSRSGRCTPRRAGVAEVSRVGEDSPDGGGEGQW